MRIVVAGLEFVLAGGILGVGAWGWVHLPAPFSWVILGMGLYGGGLGAFFGWDILKDMGRSGHERV